MTKKGLKIYLNHRRVLLLHGSRKTAKSNIALNLLCQHAFLNDYAICGIVVNGLSASVGSGAWDKLTGEQGLLETDWFPAGIGCEWIHRPTAKSDTKMRWCRIKTVNGRYSEIQIHTLPKAENIAKFKDTNFTFFYLVEADTWDHISVLAQIKAQLRSMKVPPERRQVVLDCNPPINGVHHWLHKYFIKNEAGQYPPDLDSNIQEVGFKIDDNEFLPQCEKDEIKSDNSYSPVELARNYHGRWISSSKGTAFEHQYSETRHIIGNTSSIDESQHSWLMPPRGAYEWPTGWDMGDAMNHANVISCKVLMKGRPCLWILDEIVKVGENYSADNFAADFMDRVGYWQRVMAGMDVPSIWWKFWSDSSSLRYTAIADKTMAQALYDASNEFIQLDGVKKGAGSVRQRISNLQRLLYSDKDNPPQIFVSAKCTAVKAMLASIRTRPAGDFDPKDPQKHVFDALTYMTANELALIEQTREPEAQGIISFG